MKNGLALLFVVLFAFTSFAQRDNFAVHGVLTNPMTGWYAPVTLDTLQQAKTLVDIYPKYRPAWVKEYHSVIITSTCNGRSRSAEGSDQHLTEAQLTLLRNSSPDCAVDVEITYLPNNDLRPNPVRTMNFAVQVVPIMQAKYPGGMDALKAHLKTEVVDAVAELVEDPIELVKLRFFVSETGEVADVEIQESSGQVHIDRFIQKAFCSLPLWQPARNVDGQAIRQEFEFSMGSAMLRCDFYAY